MCGESCTHGVEPGKSWRLYQRLTYGYPAAMLMYGREAQSKTRIASPATIPKSGERNRKIHSCIEILERRIQEEDSAEVNEMVRTAKVTPEQLAALLRQSATSTPNPAALSAVGATIDKEDPDNEDDE